MINLFAAQGGVLGRSLLFILLLALPAAAQQWQPLFNGKDLTGWQVRGDAIWTAMEGGILMGQRKVDNPAEPFVHPWPIDKGQFESWMYRQAWIYTVREYGEFDLHVEYLPPPNVNSGISIRDVTRAHYTIGEKAAAGDPPLRTTLRGSPAHIGYEIQIIDSETEKYPTGSVYLFDVAPRDLQKMGQWNSIDIESRKTGIKVKVNGQPASEYAGAEGRPLVGPIGLQLHDQLTFILFRNLRIREITGATLQ